MRYSFFPVLLAACLVAGCGGGSDAQGGDVTGPGEAGELGDLRAAATLRISVRYTGDIPVLQRVRITPQLSGFQGHVPQCQLVRGSLPPGTHLGSDCSIVGVATSAGSFAFVVRVSVAGLAGTVDFSANLHAFGPRVRYSVVPEEARLLRKGERVGEFPEVVDWSETVDLQMSWSYAIVEGRLPPGVTLNARSGLISGTARTPGDFTARIQATLSTPHGTYQAEPTVWSAHVSGDPTFVYADQGWRYDRWMPLDNRAVETFYIGERIALEPVVPDEDGTVAFAASEEFADFRITRGTLPPWLSFNPATGTISGRATAVLSKTTVVVSARNMRQPNAARGRDSVSLRVLAPATVAYPQAPTGRVGRYLDVYLRYHPVSDDPDVARIVASPRTGQCTLPAGVRLQQSGTIYGVLQRRAFSTVRSTSG